MIKILLAFIIVFALFFVGICTIRQMTGKEQLALIKLLTYSAVCAIFTFIVLISLVILF